MRTHTGSILLHCAVVLGLAAGNATGQAMPASNSGSGNGETRITGSIEALPSGGLMGVWQMAGRKVLVSGSTEIQLEGGAPAVGGMAEARGTDMPDGTVAASHVKTIASGSGSGSGSGSSGSSGSGNAGGAQEDRSGLKGFVESGPSGTFAGVWRVAGRMVLVSASTVVKQELGAFAPGAFVEVKGSAAADGTLVASRVEVQMGAPGGQTIPGAPAQVFGNVQALSSDPANGDWLVAGWTVRVTPSTILNFERGMAAIGSFVEVHGAVTGDRLILARDIEVKASSSASADASRWISLSGVLRGSSRNAEGTEFQIDDRRVRLSSSSRIDDSFGSVEHGVEIEMSGWEQRGRTEARVVRVRPASPADDKGASLARLNGQVSDDLNSSSLRIGDRTVLLSASTRIDQEAGKLAPGATVEVKGFLRSDGSFEASKVEVRPASGKVEKFEQVVGQIEIQPEDRGNGVWRVSGRRVRVNSSTRIVSDAGVAATGAVVEVRGWRVSDDLVDAVEIEVRSGRP